MSLFGALPMVVNVVQANVPITTMNMTPVSAPWRVLNMSSCARKMTSARPFTKPVITGIDPIETPARGITQVACGYTRTGHDNYGLYGLARRQNVAIRV